MPQSLARVYVHLVFSTKHRTPWLKDAGVRDELYRYMATILIGLESPAILINGVEDHVHVLFTLSRNYAIKKIVQDAKADTSLWIKKKGVAYSDFHWQAGYGAFSVSQSMLDEVVRYIRDQEEHHKKRSYQDEFRRLCELHEIEIDERYVWD